MRAAISRAVENSTFASTLTYSPRNEKSCLRKASRPFLPMGMTNSLRSRCARRNSTALRRMLALNAPQRPRSPVRTRVRIFASSRRAIRGCAGFSIRAMVERSTLAICAAYGRAEMARSCARRSRAAATNFIARVICWVFFTERMRRRKSRSVGIGSRQARFLVRARGRSRGKALLEGIHSRLDFGLDAVVQGLLGGDALQHRRVIGLGELQK